MTKCTRCGNAANPVNVIWTEHGQSLKGYLCKSCERVVQKNGGKITPIKKTT